MPFSRPGAIDLSALKQPPPRPASGGAGGGAAGGPAAGGTYAIDADDQNFQSLLESSMTAPVVLVVHSATRMPASAQLADDLSTIADELDGRIAVGRVDADTQSSIVQALQVQSIPFAAMVLQGRLHTYEGWSAAETSARAANRAPSRTADFDLLWRTIDEDYAYFDAASRARWRARPSRRRHGAGCAR